MRHLMFAFALAIVPISASAQQAPTADEIRDLVSRLDADDPAIREEAARALEHIGLPALPALNQAGASKSPEVRVAAAGVARRISLSVILEKPECAALKSVMATLEHGTPEERDLAFVGFFPPTGLPPNLPDSLMDIMEVSPETPESAAAGEILGWLASMSTARRLVHLTGPGRKRPSDADVVQQLRTALSLDQAELEFSAAALAIFKEADHSAFDRDIFDRNDNISDLEQVRVFCSSVGLRFRLSSTPPLLRFETPGEFVASCRAWWKEARSSPGGAWRFDWAAPPPLAGSVDAEWNAWIDLLDSGDLQAAAAARRVVSNAPAAVAEFISKQASEPSASPALQDAADRLRLRSKGRVVGIIDRGEYARLCIMDLGGGSVRDLWGPFECSDGPTEFGEDTVVVARVDPSNREDCSEYWEINLSGDPRPRRLARGLVCARPRRQGRWLAEGDFYGCIRLVDTGSGEETVIDSTRECGTPEWSPDGSLLAWSRPGAGVCLWSAATGKVSVLEGPDGWIRDWSPDGTALLVQRHADPAGTEAGWERPDLLEIVELSGKRHSIAGSHCGRLGAAWSPDGKRIASSYQDPYKTETPFRIEICPRAGGEPLVVQDPAFFGKWSSGTLWWNPAPRGLRFSPDGTEYFLIDPETGKHSAGIADPAWNALPVAGTDWHVSTNFDLPQLIRADGHRMPLTSIPLGEFLIVPPEKPR